MTKILLVLMLVTTIFADKNKLTKEKDGNYTYEMNQDKGSIDWNNVKLKITISEEYKSSLKKKTKIDTLWIQMPDGMLWHVDLNSTKNDTVHFSWDEVHRYKKAGRVNNYLKGWEEK